jgi:hypothetical protein
MHKMTNSDGKSVAPVAAPLLSLTDSLQGQAQAFLLLPQTIETLQSSTIRVGQFEIVQGVVRTL